MAVCRDTASKFEGRIVTQLLTLMDGISCNNQGYPLFLIGATNKPNDLDPAIRRPGRFDREIVIEPPNKAARIVVIQSILQKHDMLAGIDVFFDPLF